MAASSTVMAIKKIVNSVHSSKDLLRELEGVVFPVILNTLKPNFIDVIDETMEIASIIIYGLGEVSQNML